MRIDPKNGEVIGDNFSLHEHLTLAAFLATEQGRSAKKLSYDYLPETLLHNYHFKTNENQGVTLYFKSRLLSAIHLAFLLPDEKWSTSWDDFSEINEEKRKQMHDNLLLGWLGNPPYIYPWGIVESTVNNRDGDALIRIKYNHR